MGLLSFLQPKAGAGSDAVSADATRLRARRRLIGAAVLVASGVIGFPLLFDTNPRPLPQDVAIETPDEAPAPALRGAKPVAEAPAASTAASGQVAAGRSVEESRGTTAPVAAATPASTTAPAPAAPEPAGRVVDKPAASAEPPARKPAPTPGKTEAEAARALAALEGRNAAAAKSAAADGPREAAGRFVVQVGAFSEAGSARELRQRLDKLGLKSYTQVVDTAAGKRIRVRVGPYGDRGEADRAAARLKQAGLQPAVLTL